MKPINCSESAWRLDDLDERQAAIWKEIGIAVLAWVIS
ncbi:MAG: hypothetical protein QOG87_912 [Actinomycetota bacterium]